MGSHQPMAGEIAVSTKTANSTKPKVSPQKRCISVVLRSVAASVDDDVVRGLLQFLPQVGVVEYLHEVDQVPNAVLTRRTVLVVGPQLVGVAGHAGAVDA